MTITRTGSSQKYAENWARAFGKKSRKSTTAANKSGKSAKSAQRSKSKKGN